MQSILDFMKMRAESVTSKVIDAITADFELDEPAQDQAQENQSKE